MLMEDWASLLYKSFTLSISIKLVTHQDLTYGILNLFNLGVGYLEVVNKNGEGQCLVADGLDIPGKCAGLGYITGLCLHPAFIGLLLEPVVEGAVGAALG